MESKRTGRKKISELLLLGELFFKVIFMSFFITLFRQDSRQQAGNHWVEREGNGIAKDHETGFKLGSPLVQLRCMSAH